LALEGSKIPKKYEGMRDSFEKKGMSEKAAKIFVGEGKTKGERSTRAKELKRS
jgi:hypothetical protein